MAIPPKRICARCGVTFQPPRKGRYCSSACSAVAWRAANPEKWRDSRRRHYAANRDRLREYHRRRRAENPEAVNACKRAWYAANREKVRGYTKRWYEAHCLKIREYHRSRRLASLLQAIPNDSFVREIMTAQFMARSEALRAAYERGHAQQSDGR